jgi:putative RecB family exonuclease
MATYSYSKLEAFRNCPEGYKYRYIDGIMPTPTIEAFLGSRVHEALHKLYKDLGNRKLNSLDEIFTYYRHLWQREWTDQVRIVQKDLGAENYYRIGEECIKTYYEAHVPFDAGNTLGLERKVRFRLGEDDHYIQGVIDRIVQKKNYVYEVHDYKTSTFLPTQDQVDKDKQLALYQIALRKMWPDVKSVTLVWHYLRHGKELRSTRSDEDLEELRSETISLIERIESTRTFLPKESNLCEWCDYQALCSAKKHALKVAELPRITDDEGVRLANRYLHLRQQRRILEEEMETIKMQIISLAKQEGLTAVRGSDQLLKVWTKQRLKFPPTTGRDSESRRILESIIKTSGRWDEVSTLDTKTLDSILLNNRWETELEEKLLRFATVFEESRITVARFRENDFD